MECGRMGVHLKPSLLSIVLLSFHFHQPAGHWSCLAHDVELLPWFRKSGEVVDMCVYFYVRRRPMHGLAWAAAAAAASLASRLRLKVTGPTSSTAVVNVQQQVFVHGDAIGGWNTMGTVYRLRHTLQNGHDGDIHTHTCCPLVCFSKITLIVFASWVVHSQVLVVGCGLNLSGLFKR